MAYNEDLAREALKRLAQKKLDARRGGGVLRMPEIVKNCPNSLFDFVETIRPTLKVDNEPFTYVGHEYLIDAYKDFAVTGDNSEEGLKCVWMCGAQVGKSVSGFLLLAWLALRFYAKYFGYFLPDQAMAMIFSDVRFKPTVRSIPEIRPLWGTNPYDEDGHTHKTDQKRVRSIGASQIFFSYMQGATSTESIPMLAIIFDEVRKMMEGDIERAEERISHSPYPINFKFSTAGYPDANIDKYFKQSNQNKFHSKCGCKEGIVLSDVFPHCIAERREGLTPGLAKLPKYFYCCPTCGEVVENPRVGQWIAHNPESRILGRHIPQTLSCRQNAEKLFLAYQTASDLQEFHNSKLGVAYLSPEARIVTEDILRATINRDLHWQNNGQNCAMGIDQMGGFNVVTIRRRGKMGDNGLRKSVLVHLEFIYADDPWLRCDELMHQYDVSVCVADALPNINEARRFAKRYPGRVWLADYSYVSQGADDICEWGDRPKESVAERRAAAEIKNKFTVRISRFVGLEWNLMLYVHRSKEQPDERTLIADIRDNHGTRTTPQPISLVFWDHLQRLARRKIMQDETQGKFKMVFENIGIDPHFAHADLYCEIALSRVKDGDAIKPFGDYKPAEDTSKDGHEWAQIGNGPTYQCRTCGIAVKVKQGQTPQEVADNHGWKECRKP